MADGIDQCEPDDRRLVGICPFLYHSFFVALRFVHYARIRDAFFVPHPSQDHAVQGDDIAPPGLSVVSGADHRIGTAEPGVIVVVDIRDHSRGLRDDRTLRHQYP